jgi:hypothetical protein
MPFVDLLSTNGAIAAILTADYALVNRDGAKIVATLPIDPTQATHDEVARVRGVLRAIETKFAPETTPEEFAHVFSALAQMPNDGAEIARWNVPTFPARIVMRDISRIEAAHACLSALATHGPGLNCLARLEMEAALTQVVAGDARQTSFGVPMAHKDMARAPAGNRDSAAARCATMSQRIPQRR